MALPATSHRLRRRPTSAAFILAFGLLAGCGEGDLGRIKPYLVTDDIHGWIGAEAVGSIGGRPSHYGLTDEERELRDLAYPLLEAPFNRQRWYSILGEYGAHTNEPFDRTIYSAQLMARPARSATSRYALFLEDVRNDLVRIGPFFRTAARVADLDNKRAQSLPYVTDLSEHERADAVSRMAENQLVIGWVQHSMRQRVAGYRYALERLVIAYPSPMAVECELTLNGLASAVEAAPPLVAVGAPPPSRPQPRRLQVAK
jgi:hypothetical protein